MESKRLPRRRRWMRCSLKSHDGRMVRYRIVRTLLSFGTSPFPPSLLNTNLLAPRPDFVYMVPPFLAYYGADTQNASILLQYTPNSNFTGKSSNPRVAERGCTSSVPKPRRWTLVNREWVGRSWDDARPRSVGITFRAATQWECAGRCGGGIDGVH